MTFVGGASSLYRSSPIGAAMAPKALDTPTQITAGDPPQAGETLFARLNIKLAELRGRGYRLQWMEMSQKEMITLFHEAGEEVIRLDPDPSVDKAWYGDVEVRASERECVWIWLEGEVPGEMSAHVID